MHSDDRSMTGVAQEAARHIGARITSLPRRLAAGVLATFVLTCSTSTLAVSAMVMSLWMYIGLSWCVVV